MKAEAMKPQPQPMVENRASGKHILTLMTYLPVEDIRSVWAGMSKQHRLRLFGNGHAEELDTLIKHLGKKSAGDLGHLSDSEFGRKLQQLHSGQGMDDHKAARVLHTASGVRMAHRAAEGPAKTGAVGHATTMAILNARYKEKEKE